MICMAKRLRLYFDSILRPAFLVAACLVFLFAEFEAAMTSAASANDSIV